MTDTAKAKSQIQTFGIVPDLVYGHDKFGPTGPKTEGELYVRLSDFMGLQALLERSRSFVALVAKCVRKDSEYAPLHRQEMDELNRDLEAFVAGIHCTTCQDNGVIGWRRGQTPETYEEGEAPCPDCATYPTPSDLSGEIGALQCLLHRWLVQPHQLTGEVKELVEATRGMLGVDDAEQVITLAPNAFERLTEALDANPMSQNKALQDLLARPKPWADAPKPESADDRGELIRLRAALALKEQAPFFDYLYRHPETGHEIVVTITSADVVEHMEDVLFERLGEQFCQCESAGETNVVECNCPDTMDEFERIPDLPAKLPKSWDRLAKEVMELGAQYWEAASRERGPGAVQWLHNGQTGATFVYTRGEHSQDLRNFIATLPGKGHDKPATLPPLHDVSLVLTPKNLTPEAAADVFGSPPPGGYKPMSECDGCDIPFCECYDRRRKEARAAAVTIKLFMDAKGVGRSYYAEHPKRAGEMWRCAVSGGGWHLLSGHECKLLAEMLEQGAAHALGDEGYADIRYNAAYKMLFGE